MKKNFTPYIYILFVFIFSIDFFAQEFTLKISSKKISDIEVLDKIDFQKKHTDSTLMYNEIYRISNLLKNEGYFTNTIDNISPLI